MKCLLETEPTMESDKLFGTGAIKLCPIRREHRNSNDADDPGGNFAYTLFWEYEDNLEHFMTAKVWRILVIIIWGDAPRLPGILETSSMELIVVEGFIKKKILEARKL